MISKIIKSIYWTVVAILVLLILSSCSQRLVQSYRQVLPIVVTVRGDRNYDETSEIDDVGTGFFITHNHVLTVAHISDNIVGGTVELRLWNGIIIPAKKIAIDRFNDLALLQINPKDVKPYKIPKLDLLLNPQIGERIFIIGSPNSFHNTMTQGIFSIGRLKRFASNWPWKCDFCLVDANIEPGSSGSPVFNINHKFVGIVTGYYNDFTVVIPSHSIHTFLREELRD